MRIFKPILAIAVLGFFLGMFWLHYTGNQTPPEVDPQLTEYVQEWRSDMDSAGVSYDWNRLDYIKFVDQVPGDIFGDGDPNRAGFSDQSTRTVYIRNADIYEPIHVKVILYHELAHYMFDANHMGEGNIMAQSLVEDAGHYRANWDILLVEYITNIKDGR